MRTYTEYVLPVLLLAFDNEGMRRGVQQLVALLAKWQAVIYCDTGIKRKFSLAVRSHSDQVSSTMNTTVPVATIAQREH